MLKLDNFEYIKFNSRICTIFWEENKGIKSYFLFKGENYKNIYTKFRDHQYSKLERYFRCI